MATPSASEQQGPFPLLRLSNHGLRGDPLYRPSSRAMAFPNRSVIPIAARSEVFNAFDRLILDTGDLTARSTRNYKSPAHLKVPTAARPLLIHRMQIASTRRVRGDLRVGMEAEGPEGTIACGPHECLQGRHLILYVFAGLPRFANTMPSRSAAFRRWPASFKARVRSGPCGIARATSRAARASASKSWSSRRTFFCSAIGKDSNHGLALETLTSRLATITNPTPPKKA